MQQEQPSYSPIQTAFGFAAIALMVIVAGFGPQLQELRDSADPGCLPSVPAPPAESVATTAADRPVVSAVAVPFHP